MNERKYTMLMHLGQLLPGIGYFIPLVLWLINRKESDVVDEHGKIIANWMLSLIVYCLISIVLHVYIVAGVFALLNFIFIFKGTYLAYKDEAWEYPLSIQFFK